MATITGRHFNTGPPFNTFVLRAQFSTDSLIFFYKLQVGHAEYAPKVRDFFRCKDSTGVRKMWCKRDFFMLSDFDLDIKTSNTLEKKYILSMDVSDDLRKIQRGYSLLLVMQK